MSLDGYSTATTTTDPQSPAPTPDSTVRPARPQLNLDLPTWEGPFTPQVTACMHRHKSTDGRKIHTIPSR